MQMIPGVPVFLACSPEGYISHDEKLSPTWGLPDLFCRIFSRYTGMRTDTSPSCLPYHIQPVHGGQCYGVCPYQWKAGTSVDPLWWVEASYHWPGAGICSSQSGDPPAVLGRRVCPVLPPESSSRSLAGEVLSRSSPSAQSRARRRSAYGYPTLSRLSRRSPGRGAGGYPILVAARFRRLPARLLLLSRTSPHRTGHSSSSSGSGQKRRYVSHLDPLRRHLAFPWLPRRLYAPHRRAAPGSGGRNYQPLPACSWRTHS